MLLQNTQHASFFSSCHTLFGVIGFEGSFRQINTAWQTILGYASNKLSHCLFWDLVHPEDKEATENCIKQLTANPEPMTFSNRFQHADGNYHDLVWQVTPSMKEFGFYAVAIDITEIKGKIVQQSQESLQNQIEEIEQTHQKVLMNCQSELQEKQQALTKEQEEKQALVASFEQAKAEKQALNTRFEEIQNELTIWQANYQTQEVDLNNAVEDNSKLNADLEAIQKQLTVLATQLQEKQTALSSLQTDNAALSEQLEKTQADFISLQTALEEKQVELTSLAEEKIVLQASLKQVRDAVIVNDEQGTLKSLNAQANNILHHALTKSEFEYLWRGGSENTELKNSQMVSQMVLDKHLGKPMQFHQQDGTTIGLSVSCHALYREAEKRPYIKILSFYEITEQYAIRDSLQHLREDFEFVMQSKREGVLDWDLRSNKVSYSPRWKNLVGCTEQEACTHIDAWYSRIHPNDHNQVVKQVKNCLNDPKSIYEQTHRLQHKEGSYRWVASQGTTLRDNSGQPYRFMATFIDITERKRAEEALETSTKYERLFTTLTEAILLIDSQGQILEANPAALKLYGFSNREELLHQNVNNIFDVADIHTTLAPQTTHSGYHRKLDGSGFPVEMRFNELTWQGKHLFLIAVHDLTLSQPTTAQRSVSQYQQLFEVESVAIIVFEVNSHQIVDVNPAALALYGYSREEWLLLTIEDIMANPVNSANNIRLACTQSHYKMSLEWNRKKDKTTFPVEMMTSHYRFQNQTLVCTIIHDMTIHQKVEEELHRARASIQTLSQLSQATEAKLKTTLEKLPVMIFATDDKNQIALWNRVCERVTGYPANEIIANPKVWEMLYPKIADQELFQLSKPTSADDEYREIKSVLTHKNGQEKTITWSITDRLQIEGFSQWGIGQEISKYQTTPSQPEQPEAKQSVPQPKEETLYTIIQNIPILFGAYDQACQFLLWNRECEKMTGYTADEMIGNSQAFKLLFPTTTIHQRIQKECSQGKTFLQQEMEMTCKDGSRRQILFSNISKPLPLMQWSGWIVGEDISALKKIQANLSEKDFLLSEIFNNVSIALSVTDGRGRFIYLNNAFSELHGYRVEDLLNYPLTKVIPAGNQNSTLRQYFSFLTQTKEKSLTETRQALHRNGKIFEVLVLARRIEKSGNLQQSGRTEYVVWTVNSLEE
jgi:PAS domain S-box-containing protein